MDNETICPIYGKKCKNYGTKVCPMYFNLMMKEEKLDNQENNTNINSDNDGKLPIEIKIKIPTLKGPLSDEEKNEIIHELEGTKIKDILLNKNKIDNGIISNTVSVYET
jgi:hypothetical protein